MEALIVSIVLIIITAMVIKQAKQNTAEQRRLARLRRATRPDPLRPPEPEQPIHNPFPWKRFAEAHGLEFSNLVGPRVSGSLNGIDVELLVGKSAAGVTSAQVELTSAAEARMTIYRAADAERGEDLVTTGDPEFDVEFVVVCRWPSFARQVLAGSAKAWLMALGDAELSITTDRVVASTPEYETEPDRLRALVELAVEAARRVAGSR